MNKLFNYYAAEHAIDIRILRLKKALLDGNLSDEELELISDQLDDAIKLRDNDRGERSTEKIDINQLISDGLSIFAISMILGFEKTDIITSKGFMIATRLLGM